MKLPSLLLASAALITSAQAQLPDPAEFFGLRRPAREHHHDPHAGHPHLQKARVTTSGNHVFLHQPGQAPVEIFHSDFNLRGALCSPDGKLIAVVEGTGSAGDWITYLHRIDQSNGSRFIAEPVRTSVQKFVDFMFKIDPALKKKPARLRITPVTVFPSGEFQFSLTGDNDLLGRAMSLVLKEDTQPVLFEGCDQ